MRVSRVIASNGYALVRVGKDHHLADVRGYAYEHRVVAEKMIGRRLEPGEQVHHKNENKLDNRPENLEVCADAAEHHLHHRALGSRLRLPGEPNAEVSCACGCGATFLRFDDSGRPRDFVSGHNANIQPRPRTDALLQFLQKRPSSIEQIHAVIGGSLVSVKVLCSKLFRAGKINRVERGIYGTTN